MECELGCKAGGLATAVFFGQGLPGSEALDCLMQNIDEQLTDTNKQIEECVTSLLEMSQSLSGDVTQFTDPGEAIDHITETRLLEKTSCFDPEADEISRLLRHVLAKLEKQPGCEEMVMQQLFELSSREGITLPVRASASDPIGVSAMSLNMAVDHSETQNEVLWSEISVKLRKYFIEKLTNLPTSSGTALNLFACKRLSYVQSLCSLYSRADIWSKYRAIRTQQFSSFTRAGDHSSDHKSNTFTKGVQHFESLVAKTQDMMNEDFQLVNSGVFGSAVTTMEALRDIYSDKLVDEINAIVESLQSDLTKITSASPQRKAKDSYELLPKSQSEVNKMSSLRGSMRKQNSKSLDSLLSPSREDIFTDIQWLPTNTIGLQVRLVNCIMVLDTHLKSLHDMLTWQVSTQTGKPQPKRLKSALKSKREPLLMKAMSGRAAMMDHVDGNEASRGTKAMMAELTSTFKVVEKDVEDCGEWEWSHAFSKVAGDMAKCIEQHIRAVLQNVNDNETHQLTSKRCYDMTLLPSDLVGGRLDYPAKVSQGVLDLFRELDMLLPLAKAFTRGTTQLIQSAFIQSSSQAITSLTTKYKQLSSEIPDKYPVQLWYQLLANQSFIRNQLYYYDAILGSHDESSHKPYSALYRQLCEMAEATAACLLDYHTHALYSCVLQDADSNDWGNSKDFYEDERCSFTVQMWNLNMKALRAELWDNCPSKRAQSIYLSILKEGLFLLAQRYSKIKPSYRRTKLVKFDITAILLCTSELLLAGISHVGGLLDPDMSDTDVWSIHNSCCTLVAVMGVISSPIQTLYKVFKKGFGRKSRRGRDEEHPAQMYMSQWLSCVLPDLFPFGVIRMEDIQTTTAVYLQLRILYSQPEIVHHLLLQSLLMKDYTLSILLLTQVAQLYEHHASRQLGNGLNEEDTHPSNGKGLPRNESESIITNAQQIFSDCMHVFSRLEIFPAAMSRVILPVFERTNSWSSLDGRCVLGRDEQVSPWVESILECLQPLVIRIVEPGLRVIFSRSESKPSLEPLVSQLAELPCGCSPTHSHRETANRKSESDETHGYILGNGRAEAKEVLAEAIYSIIVQLVEDVYNLPSTLMFLFRNLQDKLNSHNVPTAHHCVAIQLIATGIRKLLLNFDDVTSLIGWEPSRDITDTINTLAECTYHVLTAQSYGKSSGIPRIASLFMKANKNWLSEQIETIADHFNSDAFDQPDIQPLVGHTPEYTAEFLMAAYAHIADSAQGNTALVHIYNLMANNQTWIRSQLDIPPMLGKKQSPGQVHFNLDLSPVDRKPFNPLQEHNQIGETTFDMKEIHDLDYNWSSLLQSDLGLSEVNFKYLLFNRHEMQDDADLDESEKKPVEALRKRFEADGAELV